MEVIVWRFTWKHGTMYDTRFVGMWVSPVGRHAHLCILLVVEIRMKRYIMLLWSYHIVATWNSILESKGYNSRCHNTKKPKQTKTSHNEYPGYDTKQSDGEVPVMLVLWRMQSTPSLLLLSGPFGPGMVALGKAQSMGQIELSCILILNWISWIRTVWINWIAWNRYAFNN